MPHTIGCHLCNLCQRPFIIAISNTEIVPRLISHSIVINPQKIELVDTFWLYCQKCDPKIRQNVLQKNFLFLRCAECKKEIRICYQPPHIEIYNPDNNKYYFAQSISLLFPYENDVWCSLDCYNSMREKIYQQSVQEIPPFEFKTRYKIH